MPRVRRQYIGIAIIAMIVSTTLVYLRASQPSDDPPVHLTVFRFPEDLFGVREESPSLTMSLVCQQPIGVLDVRFISTIESSNFEDKIGLLIEDPMDFLTSPPLSNLSDLFSDYGADPRIFNETIELDENELMLYTFDFDSSSGGIVGSGAFLVYDFLINSTGHLVSSCRGLEDFFVAAENTLNYISFERNENITEYFSEERAGYKTLRDRPEGGLVEFRDLSPGDVITITLRWEPNIKGVSKEVKNILSGGMFIERIEVTADGKMVDLGLETLIIKNLG